MHKIITMSDTNIQILILIFKLLLIPVIIYGLWWLKERNKKSESCDKNLLQMQLLIDFLEDEEKIRKFDIKNIPTHISAPHRLKKDRLYLPDNLDIEQRILIIAMVEFGLHSEFKYFLQENKNIPEDQKAHFEKIKKIVYLMRNPQGKEIPNKTQDFDEFKVEMQKLLLA